MRLLHIQTEDMTMFSRIAAALSALGVQSTPFPINGIGLERIDQFGHRSRGKGKGSRQKSALSMHSRLSSGRPYHTRAWHSSKDVAQSKRIAAAERKRARKAEKLQRNTEEAFFWNMARDNDPQWLRDRLHPFFVKRRPSYL